VVKGVSLIELGQAAAAILTIVTLLGLFIKWAIVKPIKIYIDHATAQIAPNANGGYSLTDANNALARIETRLEAHILSHDTPRK